MGLYRSMAKAQFHTTAMASSDRQDWVTPKNVIEAVNKVAPIELDTCTSNLNPVGAERFYTLAEDGSSSSWAVDPGHLWWCNPRFNEAKKWVYKAVGESNAGHSGVFLVPARTETRLWQNLIFKSGAAICFWAGRMTFRDPLTLDPYSTGAPFPSALILFTRKSNYYLLERFHDVMSEYGTVVTL